MTSPRGFLPWKIVEAQTFLETLGGYNSGACQGGATIGSGGSGVEPAMGRFGWEKNAGGQMMEDELVKLGLR